MRRSTLYRFVSFFFLLVGAISILAGCGRATPTPYLQTATEAPVIESTLVPTRIPPGVILFDPDGKATEELVKHLGDFSTTNGLTFETQTTLVLPLPVETRIVLLMNEPADLPTLVDGSPQTQFILFGTSEPGGRSNLSVLQTRSEDLAFMGGYLTTLIAWDWRSGALLPADSVIGETYSEAFENGGRFVCGQCTPTYSPYYYFPLVTTESGQAGSAAWGALVGSLVEYLVKAVFVDPSAALPEVLDMLDLQDMLLVGVEGTASPERFIALLGFNTLPVLEGLLQNALQGQGGSTVRVPVKIVTVTDEAVITPGKVALFDEMAVKLTTGYVYPLSVP